MLPLIFFTTNKVKLAHARYLAEEFSLKIEGFRQKTYHASYNEPRSQTREELLHSSYVSALEQAKKAGIDTTKKFFFLEDTSVVIDALSNAKEKIPGVDVKYWMKNMTFDSLDVLLRDHGDNRKVTVQSDILLHLPELYRQKWGLVDPYIVFTGSQEGTVCKKEHSFETNLVFPWLDNKTFNKWFVPAGESDPISRLSIDQANKYDFRRHAFTKMVDHLLEKGVFLKDSKQTSLRLDISPTVNPDILPTLVVCGFPCAGKTTIAQHLITKYGYMHIEASDFMRLNYYLRHDINSDIDVSIFAENALRQKPEIAAEKIAEYMEEIVELPTIISGFRSVKEILWLKNYFEHKKRFEVIFIKANERIRHERYNTRNRHGDELSLEAFKALDEQQERMGLNEISVKLECKTIRNEGSFDDFYIAFNQAATPTAKALPERNIDCSRFQDFSQTLRLEDAILLALLSKWKENKDRKFHTTTEIARIIKELFPAITPKHKDNVSRYFNQDFSAFYEIKPSEDEAKRKYRLSNSGYGKALQVYFRLMNSEPFLEPTPM